MLHAAQTHGATHKAEVGRHEGVALVVGCVCRSVGVLVERVEVSVRAKVFEYLAGMSSATHREVDVDAVGLDCEVLDALFEHYGYVVCFGCHFVSLFT